jgi:hypothetical protein
MPLMIGLESRPPELHSDLILRSPSPNRVHYGEGVSKDGRESEPAAMARDGVLRAPPHHEAEGVKRSLSGLSRAMTARGLVMI